MQTNKCDRAGAGGPVTDRQQIRLGDSRFKQVWHEQNSLEATMKIWEKTFYSC